MLSTILHKAESRGHANHGWLDTYHTFSFGGYRDDARVHFGALRVINDDTVSGGYGFGKHPHDNMEIITIVLDGALEHQDSMGNKEAIHAGEVQVMSAGTGVTHSEYNHHKDQKVSLFQIWIFPDKHNVQPRYDQKIFTPEGRKNKLQLLVSPMDNGDDGLKIHQNAWISRVALDEGNHISYKRHDAANGVYILMVEGTANVNDEPMNCRDGAGITGLDINMTATDNCDILLLEVPMEF